MKKIIFSLMVFFLVICVTSACTPQKKQNMVQSQRKFAKYIQSSGNSSSTSIDLSEGPKLKYDANLGPQNLNFDIKIVDPY